jgi:hypothetical protein
MARFPTRTHAWKRKRCTESREAPSTTNDLVEVLGVCLGHLNTADLEDHCGRTQPAMGLKGRGVGFSLPVGEARRHDSPPCCLR